MSGWEDFDRRDRDLFVGHLLSPSAHLLCSIAELEQELAKCAAAIERHIARRDALKNIMRECADNINEALKYANTHIHDGNVDIATLRRIESKLRKEAD